MRQGGTVNFLHGDHLGSTSLTTDASGTLVARQLYDAWGNIRASASSGTMPTDIGYTGQRLDATGLMHFRARYYASSLGRFVSADTLVLSPSDPQQLNRYAYALNSPLNYTDPSGHAADAGGALCGSACWKAAYNNYLKYERLYEEAGDAHHGSLKNYYNHVAQQYYNYATRVPAQSVAFQDSQVAAAYSQLLVNGLYGPDAAVSAAWDSAGGEMAFSSGILIATVTLGPPSLFNRAFDRLWRGFKDKITKNNVRPGPDDAQGLSFNVTKEGAMVQSGKPDAAPFNVNAIRESGNWAFDGPDLTGHVNVSRALGVEQQEWYDYYNHPTGPWKTAPADQKPAHHPFTEELFGYLIK
jgi:RHS repeat-associated protein